MNAAGPNFTWQIHCTHRIGAPDAPKEGSVRSAAVEALKKSADAATTKRGSVVAGNGAAIAMGSSKPPPGWEKRVKEPGAPKLTNEAVAEDSAPAGAADSAPKSNNDGQEAKKAGPQGPEGKPKAQNQDIVSANKESGPSACSSAFRGMSKSGKKTGEKATSTKRQQTELSEKKPERMEAPEDRLEQKKVSEDKQDQTKVSETKPEQTKNPENKPELKKYSENKPKRKKPLGDKSEQQLAPEPKFIQTCTHVNPTNTDDKGCAAPITVIQSAPLRTAACIGCRRCRGVERPQ